MVRVAALFHDLGRLGVPPRVIAKADILNVGEMHLLRQHPSYSRRILEGLRMEETALWGATTSGLTAGATRR
jgi:HD-GYP domain-containing protein (c-di-GMP phosphodiesterase class II)